MHWLRALGSTGSAAAIVKTLARARVANEGLKNFKEIWTTWIFVVSFCVLAFAWYRGSRRFVAEKLGELRIREYRRLAKARDEGKEEWRDLPPTPQMDRVSSALQATLKEIGDVPSDLGRRAQRDQLEKRAEELAQFWNMLDFDRRLEIQWDTEPVDAITRADKLKRFLASKGFLGDIKGIGKILSYASSVALALSLTGFAAGAAEESLSDRVALLTELKVNAALSESEAQLQQIEPPRSIHLLISREELPDLI